MKLTKVTVRSSDFNRWIGPNMHLFVKGAYLFIRVHKDQIEDIQKNLLKEKFGVEPNEFDKYELKTWIPKKFIFPYYEYCKSADEDYQYATVYLPDNFNYHFYPEDFAISRNMPITITKTGKEVSEEFFKHHISSN